MVRMRSILACGLTLMALPTMSLANPNVKQICVNQKNGAEVVRMSTRGDGAQKLYEQLVQFPSARLVTRDLAVNGLKLRAEIARKDDLRCTKRTFLQNGKLVGYHCAQYLDANFKANRIADVRCIVQFEPGKSGKNVDEDELDAVSGSVEPPESNALKVDIKSSPDKGAQAKTK